MVGKDARALASKIGDACDVVHALGKNPALPDDPSDLAALEKVVLVAIMGVVSPLSTRSTYDEKPVSWSVTATPFVRRAKLR